MKKTIFYDTHVSLGAKMSPFAGFEMPILYEGIVKEHHAARTEATIFDTCHMGEFRIEGKTSCADLESIASCNVSSIKIGRCKYGFICNSNGGVIDDLLIYRLGEDRFFIVVNASTREKDFAWIRDHLSKTTLITDVSEETAKIDIQGPTSAKIVRKLLELPINEMVYYSFMQNAYKGRNLLVSRTGYTGEIGFELFCDNRVALSIWNDALQLGARPAGLGARDTLRLEMGFPLYGHELDENHNAAESGFLRAMANDKRFIGSEFIHDQSFVKQRLSGILFPDRRTARSGDAIFDCDNNEIGTITSGSFAPSIDRAIAMSYIRKNGCKTDETVIVRSARYDLRGTITVFPFYCNGTARKQLSDYL